MTTFFLSFYVSLVTWIVSLRLSHILWFVTLAWMFYALGVELNYWFLYQSFGFTDLTNR